MKSVVFMAAVLLVGSARSYAQGVDDAQIASIVVTANQVDIDAGKLASSMAANAEVKKFGEQMVTDHTGVNKQAMELVTKLKVTPKDNPTSQSLKSGGAENVANLKKLKGAAFDKAYIDHEVAYHQQVIDALDKTLIPECVERGAEGAAGEGPAGVRRAPRAREDGPVVAASKRRMPLRVSCSVAAGARRCCLQPGPGAAAVQPPPATHTVPIDGARIPPPAITVKAGDSIVWVNKDPFPHTVTSKAGGFDSHPLQPAQSWKYMRLEERGVRLHLHAAPDDEGHVAGRVAISGCVGHQPVRRSPGSGIPISAAPPRYKPAVERQHDTRR